MKVRVGFVSNSSSSSFVAVVLQEEYENLLKNMNDLEVLIFKSISSKPKKFGNGEVFVVTHMTGEAAYWEPPKEAEELARKVLEEMGETAIDRWYIEEIICETYHNITKYIENKLPKHSRIIHEMNF